MGTRWSFDEENPDNYWFIFTIFGYGSINNKPECGREQAMKHLL
jgi:hypothetical protein